MVSSQATPRIRRPAPARGPVVERYRFRERWTIYRDVLVTHLATLGREWPLHLLCDMPGNVGDRLIWAGTDDLLAAAGVRASPLPVAAVADPVFDTVARGGCLVVPGSGALTAVWNEWLPALVAAASDCFARVVILPSQFDPSVPAVAAALSRPNVFAFAREPLSYGRIRRFGRAALAFDPALFAERLPGPGGPTPEPAGEPRRLVVFREDRASLLASHGCRPEPRVNRDIGSRARSLEEFLDAVRSVDEVVTDRLHVAVAAVMSGRRVRHLDPHDRKITTYFDFVFRGELGDRARPCTVDWLLDQGLVTRGDRPCTRP